MLYASVVLFCLATLVAAGCARNNLSRQKKEMFQQAVRKHPGDPYAYFNLGICHYNLKEYNPALKAFKKALALDPQNGEIIYSLGICYHQLGRFQEAMGQYRRLRFIDAKLADRLFKKLNGRP